jgi:hypothetical protein
MEYYQVGRNREPLGIKISARTVAEIYGSPNFADT